MRANTTLRGAVMAVVFGGAILPAMGEELLYQKFQTDADLAGWTVQYGNGYGTLQDIPTGRQENGQTKAFVLTQAADSTQISLEANIAKGFNSRTIDYAAGEVIFMQYRAFTDFAHPTQPNYASQRTHVGAGSSALSEGMNRFYTYRHAGLGTGNLLSNSTVGYGVRSWENPPADGGIGWQQTDFVNPPANPATDWPVILDKNYTFTSLQRVVTPGQARIETSGDNGSFVWEPKSGGTPVAPTTSVRNMYLVQNIANPTVMAGQPTSTYVGTGSGQHAKPTVGIMWARTGVTKTSDFNLDYKTDLNDASILLTNWQQTGKTMTQGDATGDGAVTLDDASAMLTNWQGVHDTAVGTGKISVDGVGSIYVDLKGLALWKVFVGDAAHNAVSGTNLLTMDAGVSSLPGFAVGVSKQNNVDGSPEDFGATISSNVISTGTVITDPDTGDILGYNASTPKDTKVNLDLAAMTASGRHLWLQYQVSGSSPLYTEVAVPEPTSMALLSLAGVGLLTRRRKH